MALLKIMMRLPAHQQQEPASLKFECVLQRRYVWLCSLDVARSGTALLTATICRQKHTGGFDQQKREAIEFIYLHVPDAPDYDLWGGEGGTFADICGRLDLDVTTEQKVVQSCLVKFA
jgi:hypothetical protein